MDFKVHRFLRPIYLRWKIKQTAGYKQVFSWHCRVYMYLHVKAVTNNGAAFSLRDEDAGTSLYRLGAMRASCTTLITII